MIELSIPGRGIIQLEHLVCDVNGTLTVDGRLRDRLQVHIITADTLGRQSVIDHQLSMQAVRISPTGKTETSEAEQKAAYVRQLGAENVLAIGQGANDALMIQAARIGICVLSPEGAAVETLQAADLVTPGIVAALELLEKPLRLVATLRK